MGKKRQKKEERLKHFSEVTSGSTSLIIGRSIGAYIIQKRVSSVHNFCPCSRAAFLRIMVVNTIGGKIRLRE